MKNLFSVLSWLLLHIGILNTILDRYVGESNDSNGQKIILNCFAISSEIYLKCDVIDGSVVSGLTRLIQFSFGSDKRPGYKVFCERETVHYKKRNKSVLNTITFYLEDDDRKKIDFNGETLTFTLQLLKVKFKI